MRHWKLTQWCSYAAAQIRYGPDREAVHEELRQHLDDRSDAFLKQGFSEEDAIAKALDAMGDPHELAPILAQIHRPFWGYAQDVCKWVFRFAAVLALVFCVGILGIRALADPYSRPNEEGWFSMAERPYPHITYTHLDTDPQQCSDNGYSLALTKAMTVTSSDSSYCELYFHIRVQTLLPWADEPSIDDLFWAEDSAGNRYTTFAEDGDRYVFTNAYSTAPMTWIYEGNIYGVDPAKYQWLDIHYSRDGRDMVWRIDLTGGDAA